MSAARISTRTLSQGALSTVPSAVLPVGSATKLALALLALLVTATETAAGDAPAGRRYRAMSDVRAGSEYAR